MAFEAMAWAIKQEAGSTTGKMVLLMIANYADDNFETFAGHKALAAACECSEKTVFRQLALLEERGLIVRSHRQRNDGSRTSDLIRLNTDINANNQTDNLTVRGEIQTDNLSDPNRHGDGAYTVTNTITEKTKQKILKERDQYGNLEQPTFKRFMDEIWPHRWKEGDDRKPSYLAYCKLDAEQRDDCALVIGRAKVDFLKRENQFRKGMSVWLNANGWEYYAMLENAYAEDQEVLTDWDGWMKVWRESRAWHPSLGPEPGYAGCKVPPQFLSPPNTEGKVA